MGKRGPKPVDVGVLTRWEFEFYKAFHMLRDGMRLPLKGPQTGLTSTELRAFLKLLKKMSGDHYLLTTRRLTREMGEKINLVRPPTRVERWWAQESRDQEIQWIESMLQPRTIQAQAERGKIWKDLMELNTESAIRRACSRWAQLRDIRGAVTPFPDHVAQNATKFLLMKRNKRFPRSSYGDDARLEYLARGMAGVMLGLSPMTAIERLRNMKHKRGGPMWQTRHQDHALPDNEQYCACWRCSIERSNKIGKATHGWYENGLRVLMELARTTKVPTEWR
jgi:hypothetical protein